MTQLVPGWQMLEIAGKTADVFEPTRPSEPPRAVLFFHGHGLQTLKHNPAYTSELERHGLRAICPHGKRSWWLPVVCAEFDTELSPLAYVRSCVVPFLWDQWNIRSGAVGLLGISMGGQGVLQLALRHPSEFPTVAALSPAIDFQEWYGRGLPLDDMFIDREAIRQQTATLQIQGMNWPRKQFVACDPADPEVRLSVDRYASKLRSSGVPFEHDFTTSGGGHSWDYFNRMAGRALSFIVEALQAEERRLV